MGLGHGYRPQMPTSAGQPANPPPAPLTTCAAPGTGALAPLEDEPAQSQALGEACGRGKRGGGLRPDVTALDVAWLIELFGRQGPRPPTPRTATSGGDCSRSPSTDCGRGGRAAARHPANLPGTTKRAGPRPSPGRVGVDSRLTSGPGAGECAAPAGIWSGYGSQRRPEGGRRRPSLA